MKILHLVGARTDHGGILSVLRSLQSAQGASVESAVWVHESFVERRPPPLQLRRNPKALDEATSHLRLLFAAARSWPGLGRLLATEHFDVVHAHSRGSLPLAVGLNRRAQRGGPAVLFTNHTYARRTGLYRAAVRHAHLPMVLLTPTMARHYGLAGAPGVEFISACVADHHCQAPLVPRPARPDRLRLVGIGNLVRWKNWHLLLEAWAQLPAALRQAGTCEIWGPKDPDLAGQRYADELTRQRDSLGLRGLVDFKGPTNAVAQVLTDADWFVLPSTNEPCSVALLEALAAGRPALVSASGGNVDLVQPNVTGRHFIPDDVADLTRQLTAVLSGEVPIGNPTEIRSSVLARAATPIAAAYERLYTQLLARPRSPRP